MNPKSQLEPGLSTEQAARRLAEDGPNTLPGGQHRSPLNIVWETAGEPMFLLLLVAGLLYLIFGELQEGLILFGFALVILGLTLYQEGKTERALEALRGVKGDNTLKQLILEKVNARNYVPPQVEDMYREDLFDEYQVYTGQQKSRTRKTGVPEIRVYGPGCPRCEQLDRLVMEVIARKGLHVDYQYIKDIGEMMKLGIMGSPALVINGNLVAVGRVPNRRELEELLTKALE